MSIAPFFISSTRWNSIKAHALYVVGPPACIAVSIGAGLEASEFCCHLIVQSYENQIKLIQLIISSYFSEKICYG